MLFFVGVLGGKNSYFFPNVVLIATFVYKIRVYTSCLAGAEEIGTLMIY